ncbi:site-specific integrase [Rhizobium sp. P32RR-XVIII]|uniref:tyrosine-type recombinase/integrase n=1 Tax=Rhizobium sp. P32RR-XVIII TaxID=2726738 RepID=UPI0014576C08|nr:site-specific integrase [Rhizobium sp. P32RR-XVIII]NLS03486.1 site-specific integrase [Rhizobium sp. P32RR-XVIII]
MSVRKREWTTQRGERKFAWVVDYSDTGGKRRSKTFHRKKEAGDFAARVSVEVQEGLHVAARSSVTVAKAGALWIESGEGDGLERSTLDQRRAHLHKHIVPLIGQALLSKLTGPMVRDFQDLLRKTGRSPAMIKKIVTSLGSILADANERGLATRNPVREMRRNRKGRDTRTAARQRGRLEIGKDIPSRDEIRLFIAALSDLLWRTMFLVLIFTGLRSSELRALRWRDADLIRSEIHVRQRVNRYRGKPKSRMGTRTIPISPIVVVALKALKLKQESSSEFLFPNLEGNPRSHGNVVRKGMQSTMLRGGVVVDTGEKDENGKSVLRPKYTGLHALRHFFASWLINRKEDGGLGLPAKVVQERMGHSSITVTMDTYGHLFPRGDDSKELEIASNSLLN